MIDRNAAKNTVLANASAVCKIISPRQVLQQPKCGKGKIGHLAQIRQSWRPPLVVLQSLAPACNYPDR